jgi:hypothetical protein
MRSRLSVLLVTVPLALGGLLGAHALAYLAVAGSAARSDELLAATGHGYLSLVHMVALAAGSGLIAGGLVLRAARGGRTVSIGWTVPCQVAAFVAQEHVERIAHNGTFPVDLPLQPVFLLGVALQIAVGMLIVLLARAVIGLADRVRTRLAATDRVGIPRPIRTPRQQTPGRPRVDPLAGRGAGRAPPVPIAT